MKVVHVAFECAPIYKTGGLGDVVGSLPKELVKRGIDTFIILPRYEWIKRPPTIPNSHIPVHYVTSRWFAKPNLHHDPQIQAPKYAHFAIQALEELKRQNIRPDIIHCHDWHTALVPFLLKNRPDSFFEHTKTLLTIHNIAYQGNFSVSFLNHPETKIVTDLLPSQQKRISFLKEGIVNADFISTVSPHHAREIRTGRVGFGLTQVIRKKRGKFVGIVNGIDYNIWNPKRDRRIKTRYSVKSIARKTENKLALQQKLGLEVNQSIPLFGFIARLSSQKGIDLLLPLLDEVPQRRMQVVILGTGDRKYHKLLHKYLKPIIRSWISMNFAFDEKLAHQIYAGADFFLIPSHYEPCGLTQMIAMVYGTIPVAAKVGGLKDTIETGKTGFLFSPVTIDNFTQTVRQALHSWVDQEAHFKMVRHAMRKNFSWRRSARQYAKLYQRIHHEV